MQPNELPKYDTGDNPTNCCPRFDPQSWDGLEVTFQDKPFVKGRTTSLFHIPLNMGGMMTKTMKMINDAGGLAEDFVLLSHDPSPWKGEHLFAVSKEVPGAEMVRLSGTFLTQVFEGPFSNVSKWMTQMKAHAGAKNRTASKLYLFYTTCPKCAKYYGKNYVVGFTQVA